MKTLGFYKFISKALQFFKLSQLAKNKLTAFIKNVQDNQLIYLKGTLKRWISEYSGHHVIAFPDHLFQH